MVNIAFRKAKEEDIPQLLELCRAAAKVPESSWDDDYPNEQILIQDFRRDGLYQILDGSRQVGVIAMGDLGELDGITLWRKLGKSPCEIARFGLHPMVQGRGNARLILRQVLRHCNSRGFDSARLLVTLGQTRATAMYEKEGFVYCGSVWMWGTKFRCYDREITSLK